MLSDQYASTETVALRKSAAGRMNEEFINPEIEWPSVAVIINKHMINTNNNM